MKYPTLISKAMLIVLLSIFAVSCEKDDIQQPTDPQSEIAYKLTDSGCPHVTDLIAGQHYDVGDIIISNDQANIYVTYLINEPGWYMKLSHMHVAEFVSGIPQTKKGNPKVGKFEYQMEHNKATEYTITVPYTWAAGTDIVVATHAVVDYDESMATGTLPDNANLVIAVTGGNSYFTSSVTVAGSLDGEYNGWCIDYGHVIYPGQPYAVNVYSSIGDLSKLGQVDHPENLDLVNWLLNQNLIGKMSSTGEPYTFMHIQHAIWNIVDDYPPNFPWNPIILEELLHMAYAYGEGFIPGCDDILAVIMESYQSLSQFNIPDIAQVTIVEAAAADYMACGGGNYGEETAWGLGSQFSGNSWAMYIEYTICDH